MLAPVLVVSLAACAPDPLPAPSEPAPSPTAAVSPSPEPTPTPTADTAEAELPAFASAMNGVWKRSKSVQGRDYIDALVAAGFAKKAMQVTQDETSVGNPADSIQFSVRIGDACLVGQVGPSVPRPTAIVMPGLPEGECLVGQTRRIDW